MQCLKGTDYLPKTLLCDMDHESTKIEQFVSAYSFQSSNFCCIKFCPLFKVFVFKSNQLRVA